MATETLDCKGMKCPQPVLKTQIKASSMKKGDTLIVLADCDTFPKDIKDWCAKTGKVLISIVDEGKVHKATVQF